MSNLFQLYPKHKIGTSNKMEENVSSGAESRKSAIGSLDATSHRSRIDVDRAHTESPSMTNLTFAHCYYLLG